MTRSRLPLRLLLPFLIAPLAPCAWSQDAGEFRAEPVTLPNGAQLVAPHADSVVVVSRLWLIVKGENPGDLKLNDQPLAWNPRFVGDVRVADLRLDIGMARLNVGEDEIRFALGRNDEDHAGPKEWQVYRLHNMKPGPNPCMWCHQCEKTDGEIRVGALNPPAEACFKCHELPKIEEQHANTRVEASWRESCRDCHFIHASPHKYLLRNPREVYLLQPDAAVEPH